MANKHFILAAALVLASTIAQAAPTATYNPKDPNTNDRKTASCHLNSQVDRETDRMIRPSVAKPNQTVAPSSHDKYVR